MAGCTLCCHPIHPPDFHPGSFSTIEELFQIPFDVAPVICGIDNPEGPLPENIHFVCKCAGFVLAGRYIFDVRRKTFSYGAQGISGRPCLLYMVVCNFFTTQTTSQKIHVGFIFAHDCIFCVILPVGHIACQRLFRPSTDLLHCCFEYVVGRGQAVASGQARQSKIANWCLTLCTIRQSFRLSKIYP